MVAIARWSKFHQVVGQDYFGVKKTYVCSINNIVDLFILIEAISKQENIIFIAHKRLNLLS